MTYPVSRVLALLELLQARPGLTAVQLAERLEVDERTVRRYASRLAELGIPVEAARGRYGGFRLLPGYRLPPLMLSGDEAVAVVLGLLAARGEGLVSGEQAAASAALAKIQRVLPPELRERIAAVARGVEVAEPVSAPASVPVPAPVPAEPASGFGSEGIPKGAPRGAADSDDPSGRAGSAEPVSDRPDAGALVTLAEAAGRRRRVRLGYRSAKGATSQRELDPYGLVFHPPRWYVTGLDHRSGELRVFRLDRVLVVEPVEVSFTPLPGFDPVGHVRRTLASVPYTHEVEVLLGTTLDEARRRIPSSTVTLEAVASGVRVRTRVDRLDAMAAMLAGLGWQFTVVHPEELRAEVRALAQRLEQWNA